jgi:conjugative relaxase-like TrwC/TraI family protein
MRIRVQTSAAAVKGYFAETAGEYYAEGEAAAGVWGGRGADALGLAGRVGLDAFAAACGNRHPDTGVPLTPRTRAARRVGWDVSFHCPKSLSLLYGLTGDARLLAAFRSAVEETMREVEREARGRVRRGGADADRPTGSLAWATFVHATARPVDGVVDPHLHAHCVVLNLTFDSAEGRLKALQPGGIYRSASYFEAAFHARLAAAVRALGYGTRRTSAGWEVDGLPAPLLRRFSRRANLIERLADALGITDPKARDALGAFTRERKRSDRTLPDLRAEWWGRLTADERAVVGAVLARERPVTERSPAAARDAVAYAVGHLFEREAVVGERRLLAVALRAGVGEVLPHEAAVALAARDVVVREGGDGPLVTTPEVIAEERELVAFARDGRGACRPFAPPDRPVADPRLTAGQRAAAARLLASTDRVTLLHGAAGTGKTTLMTECVRGIEAGGRRVVVLAPSAEASRGVLRREGFAAADTVARFLASAAFRQTAAGQVVWVDEAGLLGSRDAARLVRHVRDLGARLVLSGDRRQHGPVARGAVLRLLESDAGLVPAELTGIRRQRGEYRRAVKLLARGRAAAGFDVLDRLGWVRQLPDGDRASALAAEYLDAVRERKSVLVVAPTHAEGREVTAAVRQTLRAAGLLAPDDRFFQRLAACDRTAADRGRADTYTPGEVVEFHRRAGGFRPGERWAVVEVGASAVTVRAADGQTAPLPLGAADWFEVFTPQPLLLAVGDRVRVTRNGRDVAGRRVSNGALATVAGFTAAGGVVLDTGAELPPDFPHLAHGYTVTSHASQGKTVDRVLIAESSRSFTAAGQQQWYVSVSRARERAVVFTDDAAALRAAVERADPRPTATDLLAGRIVPLVRPRAGSARPPSERDTGRPAGRDRGRG